MYLYHMFNHYALLFICNIITMTSSSINISKYKSEYKTVENLFKPTLFQEIITFSIADFNGMIFW